MATTSLLVVCGAAFLAVFVVLICLAVVMRALILLFPQLDTRTGPIDQAHVTAITEGVAAAFPGTRVGQIKELE